MITYQMYIHIIESPKFPKNVVKIITSDDTNEVIKNSHSRLYECDKMSVYTYYHDVTREHSYFFENIFDCLEKFGQSDQLKNFYYFFGKEDNTTETYFVSINQKIEELMKVIEEIRSPPHLYDKLSQDNEDETQNTTPEIPDRTDQQDTQSESSWSILSILSKKHQEIKKTETDEQGNNENEENIEKSDENHPDSENDPTEELHELSKLRTKMNSNMLKIDKLFEKYGRELYDNPNIMYEWLESPENTELKNKCENLLKHAHHQELNVKEPNVSGSFISSEKLRVYQDFQKIVREEDEEKQLLLQPDEKWLNNAICIPKTLDSWNNMINTLKSHDIEIDLDNIGVEYKFDIDDLKVEKIHETVKALNVDTGFEELFSKQREEECESDSDYDPWNNETDDKIRVALIYNNLIEKHLIIYDKELIDNIIYSTNFNEFVVVSEYLIQNEPIIKDMIDMKVKKIGRITEENMDKVINDIEEFLNNDNEIEDSDIEKMDMFLLRRTNTQRTQVVLDNIVRKFLKKNCIIKRGQKIRSSNLYYKFSEYLREKYYKATIFINKNEFTPIVKKYGYHTKRGGDGMYWMDLTFKNSKKLKTFDNFDRALPSPAHTRTEWTRLSSPGFIPGPISQFDPIEVNGDLPVNNFSNDKFGINIYPKNR